MLPLFDVWHRACMALLHDNTAVVLLLQAEKKRRQDEAAARARAAAEQAQRKLEELQVRQQAGGSIHT